MNSKDYIDILIQERTNSEMNNEDFKNTLQYFAELYHKEQINKPCFTDRFILNESK